MIDSHMQQGVFSKQKVSPKCSPVALYGIVLVVAQLLVFKVGLSLFLSDSFEPHHPLQQGRSQRDAHYDDQMLNNAVPAYAKTTTQGQTADTTKDPDADGTFNGYPIYSRQEKEMYTLAHCVGENYQPTAWMHRSCKFSFLCFDTNQKEFVVFQSPEEKKMYPHLAKRPFLDVSQSYMKKSENVSNTVSIGGINLKWTMQKTGVPRLEWFPQINTSLPPDELLSFYELPPQVVFTPFHSLNGANPGHLVWDDFLPIYTILTMFQLEEDTQLLPMRYVLKDHERGLWASCDWRDDRTEACAKMHNKFLPLLLGAKPNHALTTTEDFDFQPKDDGDGPKSNLVCARHGVAGYGALTDHGVSKMHGWELQDYETTHNHGRGGMLYAFRNFMLSNVGIPTTYDHKPPFRIIFSEQSSDIPTRIIDFATQIDLIKKMFNPKYVSVESYIFKNLSLEEQLTIASQASIFVTGCGGGAVTATFLPKGGSVIMFYLEDGGVKDGRPTGTPARLDWDLFNNLAYLKVHWLPKRTMNQEPDLRAFMTLIQHEVDGLMRENSYDFFF